MHVMAILPPRDEINVQRGYVLIFFFFEIRISIRIAGGAGEKREEGP
jgi:hypothetical protein